MGQSFSTPREGMPASTTRLRDTSNFVRQAVLGTTRRISDQFNQEPDVSRVENRSELTDLLEEPEGGPETNGGGASMRGINNNRDDESDIESVTLRVNRDASYQAGYRAAVEELRAQEEQRRADEENNARRHAGFNSEASPGRPVNPSSQASKFVRTEDVPDEDMLEIQVSLRKEDYGDHGTSDYRKNMAMATAPLKDKFGVARHKIIAQAEEGDQDKSMHVQQVIVGILQRCKEGLERSKKMDWMDICTMPKLSGNLTSHNPADWWDDSKIVLWTDWERVDIKTVRLWQWCINKRFSDGDRTASNWLKEFVYASSTDALKAAVNKKYSKLPDSQLGGITYLYLTLCEMFQMSREVEEAMFTFLDIFKKKGIARYQGENVMLAAEEILSVTKRLEAGGALRDEHVMDVLSGLSVCGNEKFRSIFKHLKTNAELDNLHVLTTITPTSTTTILAPAW